MTNGVAWRPVKHTGAAQRRVINTKLVRCLDLWNPFLLTLTLSNFSLFSLILILSKNKTHLFCNASFLYWISYWYRFLWYSLILSFSSFDKFLYWSFDFFLLFLWDFFVFFSIWVFFHKLSRITVLQGKGEDISLTPHYHFHPLHRHLDVSRMIIAESSPPYIASSRTWTGDLWFPSASR